MIDFVKKTIQRCMNLFISSKFVTLLITGHEFSINCLDNFMFEAREAWRRFKVPDLNSQKKAQYPLLIRLGKPSRRARKIRIKIIIHLRPNGRSPNKN